VKTIIVCGSRDGAPYGEVDRGMHAARDVVLRDHIVAFDHVVVGSRKGVDAEAFDWALRQEIMATVVPAKWKTGERGRIEGPLRNRRMTIEYRASLLAVLAFAGGAGTADMIGAAKEAQLPVYRWLGRADGWRRDP
jgi:hypothetical protein